MLTVSPHPYLCRWALMLTVLLAQSSGLLIGATITNIKNGLAIATIAMLTLMLVGEASCRGDDGRHYTMTSLPCPSHQTALTPGRCEAHLCTALSLISPLSPPPLGGFYVRGIPVWISWLKYLSFIYWGWNLLLKIEFSNRTMTQASCPNLPPGDQCTVSQARRHRVSVVALAICHSANPVTHCRCPIALLLDPFPPLILLLPCPSKLSLTQSGQFQVDVDAPATAEACVLVGMLILFRVATYYALNRKTKFKQS